MQDALQIARENKKMKKEEYIMEIRAVEWRNKLPLEDGQCTSTICFVTLSLSTNICTVYIYIYIYSIYIIYVHNIMPFRSFAEMCYW